MVAGHNGGMAIFAKRPDKTLEHELQAHLSRRIGVLTQGTGPEASLLATKELLALRERGEWHTFGWEQITNGSWRAEESKFVWNTTSGEEFTVHLDDAGRLPELFKERVQSSTVAMTTHELPRGRVQIIGRRSLDGRDAMTWYAVAGGGADLADEAVAALVVSETDRLKAEYDV